MPVFQVTSRSLQSSPPPKKRGRRFPLQWYIIHRLVLGAAIVGLIFGFLITRFTQQTHDAVFILLPVLLSLATAQFRGYNFNALFNGTLVYLLLTACLTLIYYGIIILGPAFIQQSYSHIIAIATAISWTIMFEPVRMFIQRRIERRYNIRNQQTEKAIKAFTSTLREEIDLASLRERFLTVISQIMHPYSLSLWLRTFNQQTGQPNSSEEITIADDDPLLAYVRNHPGTQEVDRLQLHSPILQELKLRAADLVLP